MIKKVFKENTFIGFEFLPAKTCKDSIKIYHPFADLAKKHFSNRGFEIKSNEIDSIAISFEKLNTKEKIELANEIKKFLKTSRNKVINEFLIYKNGISYL